MTRDEKIEALRLAQLGSYSPETTLDNLEDAGFTIYLKRASSKRVPHQSEPMTAELAKKVRRYKVLYPNVTQSNLAARFNINPGRVSEALRGQW